MSVMATASWTSGLVLKCHEQTLGAGCVSQVRVPPAIFNLLTCPTDLYNFRNLYEILDLHMKENI